MKTEYGHGTTITLLLLGSRILFLHTDTANLILKKNFLRMSRVYNALERDKSDLLN
jgi:hypothetical protein